MDRIANLAIIRIILCTSCNLPDIGQSKDDRIRDVHARFVELASATKEATPQDLRAIHSEVVQSLSDTSQLTSITARHKQELLNLLDLSSWEPTAINGFPVYERLEANYSTYVRGRIPDEVFDEVLQYAPDPDRK